MKSISGTAYQVEAHAIQGICCAGTVVELRTWADGIHGAPVEPIFWFDTHNLPRLMLSDMGYIVNNTRCSVRLSRRSVEAAQKRFNPPSWRIFGLAGSSIFGRYIVETMARSGAAQLLNAQQGVSSAQDTLANCGAGLLGNPAFAELTRSLAQWASRWSCGWTKMTERRTEIVT